MVKRWHIWAAIPIGLVDRFGRWLGRDTERALRWASAAGLAGLIVLVEGIAR